jgi:small-conductance mechanosensitive channel
LHSILASTIASLNQVKAILLDTMRSSEGVLAKPQPRVSVRAYADSAITYRASFFVASGGAGIYA